MYNRTRGGMAPPIVNTLRISEYAASPAAQAQCGFSRAYVGGNSLIDQLEPEERNEIALSLRVVPLLLGDQILRAQDDCNRIVFPIDSVVSVMNLFENGAVAEVAMVGCDGFFPLEGLAELKYVQGSSVCQASGEAAIMGRADFEQALTLYPAFAAIIRRYMTFRLLRSEAMIACSATHNVLQRTARWLLMMREQTGRESFPITQETLALVLGVRRAGINVAIRHLDRLGAIRWRRSRVEISQEANLIAAACECYHSIRIACGI